VKTETKNVIDELPDWVIACLYDGLRTMDPTMAPGDYDPFLRYMTVCGEQPLDANTLKVVGDLRDAVFCARVDLLRWEEYVKLWPKACVDCHGWGMEETSGGFFEPREWDSCSSCWFHCPRCARTFRSEARYQEFNEGQGACPRCGWHAEDEARGSLKPVEENRCLPTR
jgi:hypothetical protein